MNLSRQWMASDGCLAPTGGDRRLDGVPGWAGCLDEEKGSAK